MFIFQKWKFALKYNPIEEKDCLQINRIKKSDQLYKYSYEIQNFDPIEKPGKTSQSQFNYTQNSLTKLFENISSHDSTQLSSSQITQGDIGQKMKKQFRRRYYRQVNTQQQNNKQQTQSKNQVNKTKTLKENQGILIKQFLNQHKDELQQYQIAEIKQLQKIYYYGQNYIDDTMQINPNKKPKFTDFNGNYLFTEQGRQINYRYEIVKILGQGAFGIVLQCIDHKYDQNVAVKIVNNKQCYKDQINVELQLLKIITEADQNQNCTIKLVDQFTFRGHICIVTEMLGKSLYQLLQNQKQLGFDQIKQYITQIVQDEIYISNLNIIHADYKPENILLNDQNKLCLIDFGSGCINGQQVYTYIMSRPYRAPEVVIEAKYDIKIDVWSIGCIIYELVTGKVLFDCEDQKQLLQKMTELIGPIDQELLQQGKKTNQFYDNINGQFVPQFQVNQNQKLLKEQLIENNCSQELIDVILACLTYNPQKRYNIQQISEMPFFQHQNLDKTIGQQYEQQLQKEQIQKQQQNQENEQSKDKIWSINNEQNLTIIDDLLKPSDEQDELGFMVQTLVEKIMYTDECKEQMQWPSTCNLKINEQLTINYIKLQPLKDNNKYIIIYSHSNCENIFEIKGIIQELSNLIQTPFILYDYPNYGKSSEIKATENNCNKSLEAIFKEVEQQYQNRKIILWGRSVGCYHSCYVAKSNNIAALIMQSPFVSIGNILCKCCTCKCQKSFNNVKQILQIPTSTKILLIHGSDDQMVGSQASQILYDQYIKTNYKNQKTLVVAGEEKRYSIEQVQNIFYGMIYGGDHNNLDTNNEYEFKQILVYFLEQFDKQTFNNLQVEEKSSKRSIKDNLIQLQI